jgi:hypothetical protein
MTVKRSKMMTRMTTMLLPQRLRPLHPAKAKAKQTTPSQRTAMRQQMVQTTTMMMMTRMKTKTTMRTRRPSY